MTPKRIQRKRSKGWKMPENTVYVGRPSRWGNPYRLVDMGDECFNVVYVAGDCQLLLAWAISKDMALELILEKYKETIDKEAAIAELKGKNLACWCKIGEPCHADVLLELANQKI